MKYLFASGLTASIVLTGSAGAADFSFGPGDSTTTSILSFGSTVYRIDAAGNIQTFTNFLASGEDILAFSVLDGFGLVALTRPDSGVQNFWQIDNFTDPTEAVFSAAGVNATLIGTTTANVFSFDQASDGTIFATGGSDTQLFTLNDGTGGNFNLNTTIDTLSLGAAGGLQVSADGGTIFLNVGDTDSLVSYDVGAGTTSTLVTTGFDWASNGLEEGPDGELYAGLIDSNFDIRIGQWNTASGTFDELPGSGALQFSENGSMGFTILNLVPTPGSIAILAIGGLSLTTRRRVN